jgi:hypothetical protein
MEIEDKLLKMETFWLSNILTHLDNEKIRKLTKELAERCGLSLSDQNENTNGNQLETLVRWRRIDMNNPPKGRVLLLTTSRMVIIGDWYKGMWRTNESFWDEGKLKSIYALQDMTHWTPIPDAPST